jgi:hypothetical protein
MPAPLPHQRTHTVQLHQLPAHLRQLAVRALEPRQRLFAKNLDLALLPGSGQVQRLHTGRHEGEGRKADMQA